MYMQVKDGTTTFLTAIVMFMELGNSLLIAVTICPCHHDDRASIVRVHLACQYGAPLLVLVPDKQGFPVRLCHVECLFLGLGVSAVMGAHDVLDGATIFASQVVCCQPVYNAFQLAKAGCCIACITEVSVHPQLQR